MLSPQVTYLYVGGWSDVHAAGMSGCLSEVKIYTGVVCFLPRRLPPASTSPPLKSDFTTRAQHLGDVQNMSGSARSRSCSTRVGKHRPPSWPRDRRSLTALEWAFDELFRYGERGHHKQMKPTLVRECVPERSIVLQLLNIEKNRNWQRLDHHLIRFCRGPQEPN